MNLIMENTVLFQHETATKIQKWFRGSIYRIKTLPLIMYAIKQFLESTDIQLSSFNEDGRINSADHEYIITDILIQQFGQRIQKAPKRMWFDIKALDYQYGWIPINIKSTTMDTSDNVGNMATCVYAYTNVGLDIHSKRSNCNSGKMSRILIKKLKEKQYCLSPKKDYYFVVVNKKNPKDVIVNSLKGLKILTGNVNNLPFQICWKKNRTFDYENIYKKIALFIHAIQKPKSSWKDDFLTDARMLKV